MKNEPNLGRATAQVGPNIAPPLTSCMILLAFLQSYNMKPHVTKPKLGVSTDLSLIVSYTLLLLVTLNSSSNLKLKKRCRSLSYNW
jgi:hypothetical protein